MLKSEGKHLTKQHNARCTPMKMLKRLVVSF